MTAQRSRRDLVLRGAALAAAALVLGGGSRSVEAKDYATRREALDELDRLAGSCRARLERVRGSRAAAEELVSRFLSVLRRHRATREDVRRRLALPAGVDPAPASGDVDADLGGLRQSLDDLMVAYAESLPVFGDSHVVSLLAVEMVAVSKLRTVIDLWVAREEA